MAQLNIDATANGIRIADPAVVIESNNTLQLSTDVVLTDTTLTYMTNGIKRGGYLARDQVPYVIGPDSNALAVRLNNDEVYTIRRVTEADGVWASKTAAPAPVDSLEQLAIGGTYMAPGTFDTTDEALFAALGSDDELVHELVYSSPSGIYVRSSNGWFRMPDDDDSLDGLEAIDVTAEFLPVFDQAEAWEQPVPRATVLEYEATTESPEGEGEGEGLEPQEIAAAEDTKDAEAS